MSLVITLLYTPADRGDRVRKALAGDADVVIVDLEDSVAPAAKVEARAALHPLLDGSESRPVEVRVNALGSPWGDDDLAMVADLPAGVEVRLPKVESVDTVERCVGLLGQDRRLHCLLETALGVERAFEIASHPAVYSIALGEADLRSELGVRADAALAWCRGRVVVAARAAGLGAPAQSVWTAVHDLDGLAQSCREGRSEGFLGRAAIHPAQLPVIRASYRPDDDEVRRAHDVLREVEAAQAAGSGVAVTEAGEFVDAAMVAGARQVVALAQATRVDDPG